MTSLVCNKRKYIIIFSLFALTSCSIFGMPKRIFKSSSKQKTGLEQHFLNLSDVKEKDYSAAYFFFSNSEFIAGKIKLFTDRYYVLNSRFVYLPDLYFSKSKGTLSLKDNYSPEMDSGSWLDDVLVEIEEKRIAGEISEMDNTGDDYKYENFDGEELSQKIDDALNGSESEKYFLDNKNQLSHMSFEDEIFQIQKKSDGFVCLHKNENQIQRIFYDLKYRTTRKEIWDKDAAVNLSNNIYEYTEEALAPAKKIIEQLTSEPPLKQIVAYNQKGLVSSSEKYVLVTKVVEPEVSQNAAAEAVAVESKRQQQNQSSEEVKETITLEKIKEISTWQYDKQNRIIKSIQKIYTYKDDTYEKLKDVFEKKYVYMYHKQSSAKSSEEEIPADTEYYEENVLRMRLVYTNKNNYTKQYFFDNDFNVTSYYVGDKLTKEVYRSGKKVLRIKTYED